MSDGGRLGHDDLIKRWAEGMRAGAYDRATRFRGDHGTDITDAVLAAAGPETDDERTARAAYLEYRLGNRLAGELEQELSSYLWNRAATTTLVGDDEFKLCYDDDIDDDDLVFVRPRDGRRFRVELTVEVEDIDAYEEPPDDENSEDLAHKPGPGQQVLI